MELKHNNRPTEAELEILHVLWQTGSASVREVNEKLNERRDIGYTTTLKLLQIMHGKGLVSRDENNRTHVYSANVDEKDIQSLLLGKFVEKAFRGSAMNLVMQALGQHKPNKKEMEAIRKLLDKIEGGKNDK
jgi:BlaI family transcriptional regulator, penicillinase repressor